IFGTSALVGGELVAAGGALTWDAPIQIAKAAPGQAVPWNHVWGAAFDYDSMAFSNGRFLAIWGGDTRALPLTGSGCQVGAPLPGLTYSDNCSEVWSALLTSTS